MVFSNDGPVKLGPGQIRPKGHRGLISHGEVKLGLLMTKGQLELEVVCARNIVGTTKDTLPGIMQSTLFFANFPNLCSELMKGR